ncbi:unnamed protein product, partial [Soboliphyme baturini]|uniref:RING-type domain-containing protein n=1 Tax=Soboliphyme baturini TaxID=241478 RepID=A0A183JAP7_9BILA
PAEKPWSKGSRTIIGISSNIHSSPHGGAGSNDVPFVRLQRAQFLHDIAEYLGIGQGATRQIIERSTFLRRYTLAEMIGDVEHKSCCICLEEFVAGEEVRVLPCTHFFHTACIDRWLITNRKCPLCRRNIDNEHLPIAAARLMN